MWLVAAVMRFLPSQRAAVLDSTVTQNIRESHGQGMTALGPPAPESPLPSSHKKPGPWLSIKDHTCVVAIGNLVGETENLR